MVYDRNDKNDPHKRNENETINKKTGKIRLKTSVIITLILHLLAVYNGLSSASRGGLEGVGFFLFFLIFGGMCVAIDTIWLVRFVINHSKRSGTHGSKKLYALITIVLNVFLLSLMARGYVGDIFLLFGILLIVCGVLDIVWIIHGIKNRYNKCHNEQSPKWLFILITVVLNISTVVAIPMLYSPKLFGVLIVLASICVVIDMIWLIIGGKSLSKRSKD